MISLRRLALVGVLAAGASLANAVTLTLWNFNDANLTSDAGVYTSDAVLIGGTGISAGGTGTGGWFLGSPTDPEGASLNNQRLNTRTYPAQGTNNRTAGVMYPVSTVGYTNIMVQFDERRSGTASRWLRFQYSLDGATWIDGDLYERTNSDFGTRSVDFSSIAGAADNPNFRFRLVTEFAPGTVAYAGVSSNYGTGGTIGYDMVQVTGTVIPEPGTIAAVATGLAGLVAVRRRRS